MRGLLMFSPRRSARPRRDWSIVNYEYLLMNHERERRGGEALAWQGEDTSAAGEGTARIRRGRRLATQQEARVQWAALRSADPKKPK